MAERCVHDLLTTQCAHCKPRTPTQLDDYRRRRRRPVLDMEYPAAGPLFPARYPGRCDDCGTSFGTGDPIRATGHDDHTYLGPCCAEQ